MPTPQFDALVAKVRNWANRDATVLTDELITDFLDYSADYCYRKLRIPPLEYTYQYPAITAVNAGEKVLQLPPDLTEIIMVSKVDSNGDKQVFDAMDVRSIEDKNTTIGGNAYAWKGGTLLLSEGAKEDEIYEIHYYRRLFDLDATYVVNQINVDAGYCTTALATDEGAVEVPLGSGNYYTGNEVYNWLRDDNERVLLWGALFQAFDYLGDDQQMVKYRQKQDDAIKELNDEEKYRKARGATNVFTYQDTGLI